MENQSSLQFLNIKLSIFDTFYWHKYYAPIVIEKITNIEFVCLMNTFRNEFISILNNYEMSLNKLLVSEINNICDKLFNLPNNDENLCDLVKIPNNLLQYISNIDNNKLSKLRNKFYLKYLSNDKDIKNNQLLFTNLVLDENMDILIGIKKSDFIFSNITKISEIFVSVPYVKSNILKIQKLKKSLYATEYYFKLNDLEIILNRKLSSLELHNIKTTILNTTFETFIKYVNNTYKDLGKYFNGLSIQFIVNDLLTKIMIDLLKDKELPSEEDYEKDWSDYEEECEEECEENIKNSYEEITTICEKIASVYIDQKDIYKFIFLCKSILNNFVHKYKYKLFTIQDNKIDKYLYTFFK